MYINVTILWNYCNMVCQLYFDFFKCRYRPHWGFPGGTNGKEPTCQCRRCKRLGFYHLVGKIPWRRAGKSTPVFWPGESHGQRSLLGFRLQSVKESETTEQLCMHRPHWVLCPERSWKSPGKVTYHMLRILHRRDLDGVFSANCHSNSGNLWHCWVKWEY